MKSKVLLLSIFCYFNILGVLAQNGPAGIGNSDGSEGQPELYLWLLPDSLELSDGDDVLSWADFSGKSQDLSSVLATSPVFKSGGLNSHDYLEFSKSNNRIVRNPFDMPSDAVSVFTVLRTTDSGDGLLSYAVSGSDNEYLLFQSNNPRTYIQGGNSNMGSAYNDGNWKIFSHQWRNSDGRLLMHLDGTQAGTGTLKSGASIVNGGAFAIGGEQDAVDGGYDASQAFQGDIAEMIVYGSSLKIAERTVVENYLAQKYGLDANLPIDMYAPSDASYIVDMSGMGKESDGTTELSSGGLVVTQNGNFINGDYLFAAHNGTVNSVNSSPGTLYPEVEAAWQRDWYIDKTGTVDIKLAFDFGEGIGGDYPANIENYRLLYKANLVDDYDTISVAGRGVQNGDQLYFSVDNAQFNDGYYTLGTINQADSPLEGVSGRTWYTLISGDWNNWEVWTLDPSGALPNNPDHLTPSTSSTAGADKVVILTGKTVTVLNNNKTHSEITVDGRLDFQSTSGHSFGKIKGRGRILLSGDNFPSSSDATHFISEGQGEGTVVYYGSANFNLSTPREFYNLEIEMNAPSTKLTLLKDYTVNGYFRLKNGTFQINDNSSTTNLNINVTGDVNVESNASISTGTGNARHQLNLYSDFTNQGTVAFTNRVAVAHSSEATDGIVDVNFLNGSKNQSAFLDGPSTFYRVEIDKGTDDTYELALEATDATYFKLYGYAGESHGSVAQLTENNNALGLIKGTARIKSNISIPVLNNTGNYNISEAARLWLDGGFVAKNSGTAIVPYGKIQVSNGTLEAKINSGITIRGNGLVRVEGGTLTINQLRTSVLGAGNVGGYVQSGGTTNILGGITSTDYYCFNLTYPGNVFSMSGGTLHIHEAHGKGGIFIASSETNYNVTGGTVVMEISDGNDFPITSTAPFWNVIVRNSHSGTGKHLLTGGTGVGSTNESLPVQDLHVLNDLTIETGTTRSDGTNTYGSYLDLVPDNTNAADLYVGGDLTIEDSGVLDIWAWNGTNNNGSSSVTFNGSKDAVLYVGDIATYTNALVEFKNPDDGPWPSGFAGADETYGVWTLPFYNLILDKPNATLSLASKLPGKGHGSPHGTASEYRNANGGRNISRIASWLLRITNKIAVLNGTFSQIDPLSNITWLEDDGVSYGDVGDPVAYSIAISQAEIINYDTLFVFEDGVTPITGVIRLRNSGDLTIETKDGAYFGNFDVSTGNNVVSLTSDVKMGRLRFTNGILDIGTHNLKTDVFEFFVAASTLESSDGQAIYSKSDYIRMAGNASDGGLSIKLPRSLVPYESATPTWPDPPYTKIYNTISSQSYYEDGQEYNTPDRVWFPIGTNAGGSDKYTPAVMFIADDAAVNYSGDEYVTVRLVNNELQTTDLTGGDVIPYYWNVNHEGFDEGLPEVSWIFQYDDSDIRGDESTYVPGKVLDGGSYTRSADGDATGVKDSGASGNNGDILGTDPNNIILFNGITGPNDNIDVGRNDAIFTQGNIDSKWASAFPGTGFTLEKANYTAGVANRFTGDVEVYYSIATNINDCNWNDGSNWARNDNLDPSYENHDSRQPAAGDYPQEGDVAIIGWCPWDDGNGNIDPGDPHLIRLTTDIECAQLIFTPMEDISGNPRAREPRYSVVFRPSLGIYSGRNLTTGLVEGEGMFWCKSSDPDFTLMDLGEFAVSDSSYILYENYNASRSYLNMPSESPNLMITSNSWGQNNNTTIIATDIKTNGSFEIIGDANVELDTDATGDITIGGNLMISEVTDPDAGTPSGGGGEIRFQNSGNPRTITVGGDILLNNTSNRIYVQNAGGNNIAHQISVEGNITQSELGDGLLFSTGIGNDHIDLTLNGNSSKSFNITAGNIPEFHRIILNKGTDQTSSFTFNGDFNLNGPTSGVNVDKAIELQNGTLILNHSDINVNLNTGDDDFYIPGTAGLEVRQGQAKVNGNSGIILDGKLELSGGTVDMSGGDNYIQYSAGGGATIDVSSGTLTVGSQIRRGLTSSEGILNYTQSGGTVVVGNNAAPENERGVLEVLNAGSNFSLTGGDLYIARAQDSPGKASLYLDPATSNVDVAANIFIGHANTPTNQTIGIYSNIGLPNLTIDNSSANSPAAQIWTVPLTVNNHLDIQTGASFDANGLNLILNGDMTASGTFTANNNTTFFSSNSARQIVGSPAFYNVTKNGSGTLSLNNDVTINNVFNHQSGVLSDNSNTLSVKGNLEFNGAHNWGGSGNGIQMNGAEQQNLLGSGAFGKLTINNSAGIFVPEGNTININGALQLDNGVFDVGKNLLELTADASIIEGNAFSEQNMIQTNISFTDAGVKKWFPAISTSTTFIYPIGSAGKYTPVEFNIDNVDVGGYIRVKAADEAHPTVVNDDEPCNDIIDELNVLKYHWVLESGGISNLTGSASMKYYGADVQIDNSLSATTYDVSDYITARLLRNSTEWNKYDPTSFDQINELLTFQFSSTDDNGVSGSYTAGVEDTEGGCEGAIPDEVPVYITIADGIWGNALNWATHPTPGGSVPAGGPRGSSVIIAHDIHISNNYKVSYRTEISGGGKLSVGSTFGHRLGEVSGQGTLSLLRGDLPAGVYDNFLSASGGTLEYGGSNDYDVLSENTFVNNLRFVGSGSRRLPNLTIQAYGDIELDGPSLINEHNRTLSLNGDFVFDSGSFDAGTGTDAKLVLNGTANQNIGGLSNFSGGNSLNRFEVNNSAGVLVESDVEIETSLALTNGVINNSLGNRFVVLSYSAGSVSGGSSSSYVWGPFEKSVNTGGSFVFPVGDNGRYGSIELSETGTASAAVWGTQYYNHNPGNDGFDPNSMVGSLKYVSNNEYWRIKAPEVTDAHVTIRWDAQSGVSADATERQSLRIVNWKDLTPDAWEEAGSDFITNYGQNDGSIKSDTKRSFNEFPEGNYFTLGGVQVYTYPWLGTSDDWFDSNNWNSGNVPSISTEVEIPIASEVPNMPVINGDAFCKDLVINGTGTDLGTVTLRPGATLEISNDVNSSGTIVLESTNASLSSLMLPATTTNTGNVNVQLTLDPDHYWYLSSPLTSAVAGWYKPAEDVANDYVYVFEVLNNRWQWIRLDQDDVDANRSIGQMQGVAAYYYTTPKLLDYTGTVNNADATIRPDDPGYHLVGNPFPTAIDWEDPAGWVREGFSNSMWSWITDGTERVVQTYNNNGDDLPGVWTLTPPAGYDASTMSHIPPYQSVWLKQDTTDAVDLTVKRAARVKESDAPLKSTSSADASKTYNLFRVQAENSYTRDGAVLYFHEMFAEGEGREDSEKRFNGSKKVPEVYTRVNTQAFAINGQPPLTSEEHTYSLSVRNRIEGEVKLSFDLSEFTNQTYEIFLEDKETGSWTNIREVNEYAYTPTQMGDDHDRFVIHLEKANEVPTILENNETGRNSGITIIGKQEFALVQISAELIQTAEATIEVLDMNGRLMKRLSTSTTESEIDLPDNSGVYVVRVTAGGVVKSEKVVR